MPKEPNALERANRELVHEFIRSLREGDGSLIEADSALNDASRKVVEAMRTVHGEAWLGHINLSADDRGRPERAMWLWDGSLVYTFGAAFVAPKFDEELVRLIIERDTAPYTGATADVPRINAILARLTEIGGIELVFT